MRYPQGCVVLFLILVLSTWGQLTVAQPPQAESDLQQIVARSKLIVALVDTDYPPLFATSQTGQLQEGLITEKAYNKQRKKILKRP